VAIYLQCRNCRPSLHSSLLWPVNVIQVESVICLPDGDTTCVTNLVRLAQDGELQSCVALPQKSDSNLILAGSVLVSGREQQLL
jgi:hypothetical protein